MLLDQFPHRVNIWKSTWPHGRTGQHNKLVLKQGEVQCWVQSVNANDNSLMETLEYNKRGVIYSHKIYFKENPNVTEQDKLQPTYMYDQVITTPVYWDIMAEAKPDMSAGLGVIWRVLIRQHIAADE